MVREHAGAIADAVAPSGAVEPTEGPDTGRIGVPVRFG